jgi:hypothetical protein
LRNIDIAENKKAPRRGFCLARGGSTAQVSGPMKQRGKCDKGSADPAHHTGPFVFVADDGDLKVGRCKSCGNAVIRPKGKKP